MRGTKAVQRLIDVAQSDSGQSEIIRLFLLSLYNGDAFSLVPYRLRNLDLDLRADVLEVLRMELFSFHAEIHQVIPGTGHLWQEWKEWYRNTQGK